MAEILLALSTHRKDFAHYSTIPTYLAGCDSFGSPPWNTTNLYLCRKPGVRLRKRKEGGARKCMREVRGVCQGTF